MTREKIIPFRERVERVIVTVLILDGSRLACIYYDGILIGAI
jgi:hypothetical protein